MPKKIIKSPSPAGKEQKLAAIKAIRKQSGENWDNRCHRDSGGTNK